MSKATVEKWWPIYLVGVFIGIGFGWLLATATANQHNKSETAIIMMDAFHSGWVPKALSLGETMDIKLASDSYASEIRVPLGTVVTFFFRNEIGSFELRESYETQYETYYTNKLGNNWEPEHAKMHDTLPAPRPSSVGTESAQIFSSRKIIQQDFQLEGYDLNVSLDNSTQGNIEVIEFVANQLGEFEFQCNKECGPGYELMIGKLVVTPKN